MLVDVMQYLGSIDSKPVYWFSSSHSEDLIPNVCFCSLLTPFLLVILS